jgi:hypothetical protein
MKLCIEFGTFADRPERRNRWSGDGRRALNKQKEERANMRENKKK